MTPILDIIGAFLSLGIPVTVVILAVKYFNGMTRVKKYKGVYDYD